MTHLKTVGVRGVVDDGHLGQVSSQHVQVLEVVALQRHARISVQAVPAYLQGWRGAARAPTTSRGNHYEYKIRLNWILVRACTFRGSAPLPPSRCKSSSEVLFSFVRAAISSERHCNRYLEYNRLEYDSLDELLLRVDHVEQPLRVDLLASRENHHLEQL